MLFAKPGLTGKNITEIKLMNTLHTKSWKDIVMLSRPIQVFNTIVFALIVFAYLSESQTYKHFLFIQTNSS
jgi:hypothetical protein